MRIIFVILLFTSTVFGQLGYVTSPTNAPVNGYVVTRTGDRNKWLPGGGGSQVWTNNNGIVELVTNTLPVWLGSLVDQSGNNGVLLSLVDTNSGSRNSIYLISTGHAGDALHALFVDVIGVGSSYGGAIEGDNHQLWHVPGASTYYGAIPSAVQGFSGYFSGNGSTNQVSGISGYAGGNQGLLIGAYGEADPNLNASTNIGIFGNVVDEGKSGPMIGGYFEIGGNSSTDPIFVGSHALLVNNRTRSDLPLFTAQTNLNTTVFQVTGKGNLKWQGVEYAGPSTNGTAGQAMVTDGNTPQQLSWAEGPTTANFTNEIKSIITNSINQNARIGPGTLNQIAKFTSPTNVGDSILYNPNASTIAMTNGSVTDGGSALQLLMYGKWVNSSSFEDLVLAYSAGTTTFDIYTDTGVGGGTKRDLRLGTGGQSYWRVAQPSGDFLPVSANAVSIGAHSDGIKSLYTDGALWADVNGDSTHPYLGVVSGTSLYIAGDTWNFISTAGNPLMTIDMSSPPTLRLGTTRISGGANSLGTADDAFILRSALGSWQIGTNLNSSTLTTNRIHGPNGSGSNIPGGPLMLSGGASTGSGTSGNVIFETATNGSAISTVNGRVTRESICGHEISLTESSATLVVNVVIQSKAYIGGVLKLTTHADDGTDGQVQYDTVAFSAWNKSGTVTVSVSASTPSANAPSTGSLTTVITGVANGNSVDFKVNAVSSLSQTTLKTSGRIEVNSDGPATVTWQ